MSPKSVKKRIKKLSLLKPEKGVLPRAPPDFVARVVAFSNPRGVWGYALYIHGCCRLTGSVQSFNMIKRGVRLWNRRP